MTPLPPPLGSAELVIWRLDQAQYRTSWDSGEGSYIFGGRWNAQGVRAVYCSLDPATAILEVAAHEGFPALDTVVVITTTNFMSTGTGTLMLDGNLARTGIGWSPDQNLTLIERFTRLDNDRMYYEFTIDDPTVWAKPWTARIPLTRIDQKMYEYACHEGNHDFGFILAGQRTVEKDAAAAAKTGSEPNPR